MKSTITEKKNTLHGFKGIFEQRKISKLEDSTIEIVKSEEQKEGLRKLNRA